MNTLLAIKLAATQVDQKKKKPRRDLTPWLAGGAALGGYGLTHLANTMLSNDDELALREMPAVMDHITDSTDPRKTIDLYMNNVGNASRTHLWGRTVKDWMKPIRSLPWLPEASKWKGKESEEHYDNFAAGPVSAHREMLVEWGKHPKLPDYDKAVSEVAAQQGFPAAPKDMSVPQQKLLYGLLHRHIDKTNPQLSQALAAEETAQAPEMKDHASGYGQLAGAALLSRDAMRWGGAGLGLLGAELGGARRRRRGRQRTAATPSVGRERWSCRGRRRGGSEWGRRRTWYPRRQAASPQGEPHCPQGA